MRREGNPVRAPQDDLESLRLLGDRRTPTHGK